MSENTKDRVVVKSPFLQVCETSSELRATGPLYIVIFGGAGDLSRRKLIPTLYQLYRKSLVETFSILGFGLPEMTDDAYRTFIRESLMSFSRETFSEQKVGEFIRHFFYQSADLDKEAPYKALCSRIAEFSADTASGNIVYYLAVPPGIVPGIVKQLSKFDLCRGKSRARIIVEKPFGNSSKTAAELNKRLLEQFDERQIYRIDHYLGKETVQNIIFFRFGNSIFEHIWNRNYIDHIQIIMAEDIGVENRGRFYEEAGVIRDIVQNHLMQLIALVAMEPPVGFGADFIRDEKVKVFRTIRPMDDEYLDRNIVVGQYGRGRIGDADVPAYREDNNVAPDSITPTYFAGKFYIDNWRWADVPFYVRTGKRLAKRCTEIAIEFKQHPLRLLGRTCDVLEPNTLIFSIQPQEEIALGFSVKLPGAGNQPYPVNMVFNYEKVFHVEPQPPYERLLLDCVKGDQTLFARQDGVEAMWAVVDPVIERGEHMAGERMPIYAAGGWGPREANDMMERDGRKWRSLG